MFELHNISQRFEHWWTGSGEPPALRPRLAIKPIPVEPAVEWMPSAWRQRHSRFLDQQFWCFGQDILQQPRNALLELGFSKHRPLKDRKDGSCYTVTSRTGVNIVLWGFGMFYSDQRLGDAILLVRDDIRPWMVEQMQTPVGVWDPLEIPRHRVRGSEVAGARELLADLLKWLAQYEAWIADHRTPGHRERTLREWKRVVVPALESAEQWQHLADEVRGMEYLAKESA